MQPRREKSGFFSVMLLGFSGFSWLLKSSRSWPAAMVPALVWCALSAVGVFASVTWLQPWLLQSLPSWSPTLTSFASWSLTVLAGVLVLWLALLLAVPLSGPALERLVAAVELDIGAPPRPKLSFFAEAWCGVRAMVVGLLLTIPLLVAALVLDLFVPVLAPVAIAIKLLATALGLSWGLLDYPLTLRGIRMRERLALMRRHWRQVLGFGMGMMPFFFLPCCQFVSLPVGVVAATLLYAELARDAQLESATPS